MNKYRNNFYLALGVILTFYNLYGGFYAAYYDKGNAKIAIAAALCAASVICTLQELRKPRKK